ncbi:hypothetical protein ACT3UD_13220 [Glutamicibacter sp. 287]|uniref:hypothetical protein n=1 Tax=unclassified Glutamicibacter TaxID=2627139 RepID=UPI0015968CBD|nr:hypothetical protein [Glutamicibacter sp. BW80]
MLRMLPAGAENVERTAHPKRWLFTTQQPVDLIAARGLLDTFIETEFVEVAAGI